MERSSADQGRVSDEAVSRLRDNYNRVLENIARAAERSGRTSQDIELVAVTKTISVDIINQAIELGVRHIGENRVQELASKYDSLIHRDELNISLIGHLQSNKAKSAVGLAGMIQSVDSEHIAREISKRAQESGKIMPCLIEINIGDEESKSGISFDRAEELVYAAAQLPSIEVCGLMTIPPADAEKDTLKKYFQKIFKLYVDIGGKNIHNNIQMKYLSMGMSSDYETAIECGSNMVRVGTALFGARYYT